MLKNLGTLKLETKSLTLKKFSEDFIDDMISYWISDPEVQSMYEEPVYKTKGEVSDLIKKYETNYERKDYYRWAIIEKNSKICIGQIAIFLVDSKNHFGEIEFCLGKNFQRKGYMKEAVTKILEYSFENINFHKIQVSHKENNVASKKLINSCKFIYEGTLRDYFYTEKENKYISRLFYSILKDEWFKNN